MIELNKQTYLNIRPYFYGNTTEIQMEQLMKFLKGWCDSENRNFELLIQGLNGFILDSDTLKQRIQLNVNQLIHYLDVKFKVTYLLDKTNQLLKVY